MFLIMGVTLYTSRVILEALGVSDFGIYSIVGGIVAMMGFINGAMASSTQRFLSFDIGLNNKEKLKNTFNTALTVHIFIGITLLIIGESVGLWYVNNVLVFPDERLFAVNVVYQFSLLTLFLNIIQVPYNSLILAREHMNVYAYVSIIEVTLKLLVAYILLLGKFDQLILFSILSFLVALIVRIIYQIYCRRKFDESRYEFKYDKSALREMLGFSSWNLFGSLSLIAKNQGVNIVLNLFFGTIINAAYGIVMQVQSAATQFVTSFQSAINPQIVQRYATGKLQSSLNLIFSGSKYSFFVMGFIVVPIICHTGYILHLWLGDNVPDHTINFLQLSLIALLIDSISGPLMTGILASGNIKRYQIFVGGMNAIIPVLVYFLFKNKMIPEVAFWVMILFSMLSLVLRVWFLKINYSFELSWFLRKVIGPIVFVSICIALVVFGIDYVVIVDDLWTFALWVILFFILYTAILFSFGIDKQTKHLLLGKIKGIIGRA